ncbi:MAG: helix-turn-helix domain-containing protein [Crocinitomicaceae bacterium]
MLIQDRIRLILKANQLTSSEFADRVGVNRASLSHVLSGRNKPSHDFLSKIISEFPNVNASWLVTGETRDGGFKGDQGGVQKDAVIKQNTEKANADSKAIVKIIHYYADGTFDTFLPNA